MDIEIIKNYLEDKGTAREGGAMTYIDTSFETMPSEYIDFAEKDLQTSFEHKYINSLSNTKRALDCQADRLLKLFGFFKEAQRRKWGFPQKIELIQRFDILTPRILNKINKNRNLMEHQYMKPDATQAEDFLDVVSLFLASTEHYTSNSLPMVYYSNYDSDDFPMIGTMWFEVDIEEEKLIIKPNSSRRPKPSGELEILRTDPEYIEVYKRHLKKIDFR